MGEHLGNFPQSQKYLWLYLALYKPIEERMRSKFSVTFSLIPVSLPLTIFIFSKLSFCWKFLQHLTSLTFKVCFLSFTLVFHVCFGWLLMRVVQILRNVLLSWIHVYLLWNIKDLKLSTSEYERIEKCRKQDT